VETQPQAHGRRVRVQPEGIGHEAVVAAGAGDSASRMTGETRFVTSGGDTASMAVSYDRPADSLFMILQIAYIYTTLPAS
jgi:hypothetical protein